VDLQSCHVKRKENDTFYTPLPADPAAALIGSLDIRVDIAIIDRLRKIGRQNRLAPSFSENRNERDEKIHAETYTVLNKAPLRILHPECKDTFNIFIH
jgi:hypothetical protein